MNRRSFMVGMGVLVSWPLTSKAQQVGKVYRIGLLGLASTSDVAGLTAFRRGLRDLGYEEGKNLVIEYRWAEGKYERLPPLAAELVGLKVDVILTYGTPGALAAKQATKTIPVVVAIIGDAVASEIVATLARPGGNITGSQFHFPEIMAKRVELLRQAMPGLDRVAVLVNTANPSFPPAFKAMHETARSLRVQLRQTEVQSPDHIQGAFAAMAEWRAEAVILVDDPMLRSHGRTIAGLAAELHLPSVGEREYAEHGGLLAYTVNRPEVWRRAANFVDKILKGTKPGDLPFEQADRLELVINLKTAKALGLTIPPSLLLRADQVIE